MLRVLLEHEGEECGVAEASIIEQTHQLGWTNAQRTAMALERRKWMDARGEITDAGKAALLAAEKK